MKKIGIFVLLFALLLTACGNGGTSKSEDRLQIVATVFPQYDWVRQILGEQEADVTLLLDNGVDLHSYQPTADDILTVSNCDLFLYVGGESDGWVEDVLAQAANKDMVAINLLDALGSSAKEEEVVEGMEADEEEEEETAYDEHIWLSLKNAGTLCQTIADALCKLDADHADTYRANVAAYQQQLAALDGEYQAAVDDAKQKTLLFGDRFPFRYLADDYGLNYYAAFSGCSAETEASFETITFLAGKVDELQLRTVLTLEGSDQKIAQTIIDNTQSKDQQILSMDSMQSVTATRVADGASYLDIMKSNLTALQAALEGGE